MRVYVKWLLVVVALLLSALAGAAAAFIYLDRHPVKPSARSVTKGSGVDADRAIAELEKANSMPWKIFRATIPNDGATFRCLIQLDDYYNFDFSEDQRSHHSIRISDLHGHTWAHGYVPRKSEAGEKLFASLKDAAFHPATLMLSNARTSDPSCVEVLKIVDLDIAWGKELR